MRVNVYAEEITDRVELVEKGGFVGVRIYLALPVSYHVGIGGSLFPAKPGDTRQATHLQAPFIHHPGDDDSGAITFFGRKTTLTAMKKAVALLEEYHASKGDDAA